MNFGLVKTNGPWVFQKVRTFTLDVRANGDYASGYSFFRTSAESRYESPPVGRPVWSGFSKDKTGRSARSTQMRRLMGDAAFFWWKKMGFGRKR